MKKNNLSAKYSLFGRFDYIEATPEIISKLYDDFSKDGFMPNMVTLLKIVQPQNTVEQTLRPQLLNKQGGCTLTILPERVDLEFIGDADRMNAVSYLSRLVALFELKINRIALNTTIGFDELSEDDIKYYCEKLTPPLNYGEESGIIEYSSRRVSRKTADCIGELINVGRNITGIADNVDNKLIVDRIQIDTDINTLGEYTKERFSIDSCKEFFELATVIHEDVIGNFMVMRNEN